MHFIIRHHTRYEYSQPVNLTPQQLRFLPRTDGSQQLISYQLTVTPEPTGRNEHIDLEGNRITQLWFTQETDYLDIEQVMQVETLRRDAYDFILSPEATALPLDYGKATLLAQAYLEPIEADKTVTAFTQELMQAAGYDTLTFLNKLNTHIFTHYKHIRRETGKPQSPALTLQSQRGACRDLTVLFIDCCRIAGIAARFVSGYHKGNLARLRRDLHAWPEVYLPGAGWRGFDPTQGITLADTHVTIAAAAQPYNTMPVSGGFRSAKRVTSKLSYTVNIQVTENLSSVSNTQA